MNHERVAVTMEKYIGDVIRKGVGNQVMQASW